MEITIFVIDHRTAKVSTALLCSDWDLKEDMISIAKSSFKFRKNAISSSLLENISENDFVFINKGVLAGTPFGKNGFLQKIESFQEDSKIFTIKTKSLLSWLNIQVIPLNFGDHFAKWIDYFQNIVADNCLNPDSFGNPPWMASDFIEFIDSLPDTMLSDSGFESEKDKQYNFGELIRKSFDVIDGNQEIRVGNFAEDTDETVKAMIQIENMSLTDDPLLEINLNDDFIDTPSITIAEETAINYLVLMPSPHNAYYTSTKFYSNRDADIFPNISVQTYADSDWDKDATDPLKKKADAIMGQKKTQSQQISFSISSGLFDFGELKLARKAKLYWKGKTIESRVTAFQFTNNLDKVKVTFGYTRNALTDKLQSVETKARSLT